MDIDIIGKLNDWTLFTYKNLFGLFSKYAELGKSMCLKFWVPKLKVVELYHNTYILLFCIDLSTKSVFMI